MHADFECRDDSTPDQQIERVYEQFQDRLDDLVRSYWLLRILNLDLFPAHLHAQHHGHLKQATQLALAVREVGRLHRGLLAPRTAILLNTVLPTGPEDRAHSITFSESDVEYLERMRQDIDATYDDDGSE